MTDYIKRAVELADGWEFKHETYYGPWLVCFKEHELEKLLEPFWRPLLDALAAQLVRQVDALFPDVQFNSDFGGCCWLFRESDGEDWHEGECGKAQSNDRTLNTIKAIIDSKVLEGGQK